MEGSVINYEKLVVTFRDFCSILEKILALTDPLDIHGKPLHGITKINKSNVINYWYLLILLTNAPRASRSSIRSGV